jgi:hypothetical protein
MTLAAACGWSLARSLAVATLALPVCRSMCTCLQGLTEGQRRVTWLVLVLPFLCPELWTGYAWSGFAVRLAGSGVWEHLPTGLWGGPAAIVARDVAVDELLLDVLLFVRLLPVGTLALYFAPPPPLSAEALYCRELAVAKNRRRWLLNRDRLAFLLRGPWHGALPAAGLMFLVCFQEFELPSLIARPAWTVWLFDAQVGGLALNESLRRALWPVAWQLLVAAPLIGWAVSNRGSAARRRVSGSQSPIRKCLLWCVALSSIAVVCIVPLVFIGRGTVVGLSRVVQNTGQFRGLLGEIFTGLGYAVATAVASALFAVWVLEKARTSRLALAGAIAAAVPGMFGSLILGLSVVQALQLPYVRVLYKTPMALAAGMALYLMPRAIVMRLLLWSNRQSSGAHLATLLGDSPSTSARDAAAELMWRMRWRGEVWYGALLAWWAFLDLTLIYLLSPVTIVSAPVMLYNQMHFGKNAVLSALVFLTVAVPALAFAAALASRRLLFRWVWR